MSLLAKYACNPDVSRGRLHKEDAALTRTDYQRDRDRIVHSSAFRRLVYKTQVFLNHEGDLFRTRMTHSLEVAQLGRSIARHLGLNEDLVEAIALAHDLGHTPFGHAGQDALNVSMQQHGGFEHNLQSLRVVDLLEKRYPAFDGLNLTFETREGILKHCSRSNAQRLEVLEPFGVAYRFITQGQPSLEAQLCNLSDEIAYNAHDIDDGVRSGLITLHQLQEVELFDKHRISVLSDYPELADQKKQKRLQYETIRRMLSEQVYDVMDASQQAIVYAKVDVIADVRSSAKPLIQFNDDMRKQSLALKQFLMRNLYRHPQVMQTTNLAKKVLTDLFDIYVSNPSEMRDSHFLDTGMTSNQDGIDPLFRSICDFIAGMTDRYATKEHERLTGYRLWEN